MDDADRAQSKIDQELAKNLSFRKPEGPHYCGECYNCGEALPYPRRFCDFDCMQDYDKRKALDSQRLDLSPTDDEEDD